MELAKSFAEFVLGAPAAAAVAEPEPKRRRKNKPMSAERKAQLMQQLVNARAARQAKLAEKRAA